MQIVKNVSISAVTALVVVAGWAWLVGGNAGQSLQGTTNYDQLDVTDGYSVDGTTVIDGDGNVDAPITTTSITASGDITQSTSNTATTSAAFGCIETVATSTETAIHIVFSALSATSTFGGTADGIAAWAFGSCPV